MTAAPQVLRLIWAACVGSRSCKSEASFAYDAAAYEHSLIYAAALYDAIEAKLGEQRRFVLWWDQQEKAAGSLRRGESPALAVNDAGQELSNFGLDRDTVHRWRKRLKEPSKFDAALEAAMRKRKRWEDSARYYGAAKASLWTEWRAGQQLRELERRPEGRPTKTLHNGEFLADALSRHGLAPGTAYRWIAMSYAPRENTDAVKLRETLQLLAFPPPPACLYRQIRRLMHARALF